MKPVFKTLTAAAVLAALQGCQQTPPEQTQSNHTPVEIVGTTHPFAAESIYFVMTDRFVDGDPSNNYPNQGGEHPTYQLPLNGPDGQMAYVGYMGGDFKGIANNADYIRDLGFTAVWLSPVVDNPDEAFAGGEPIEFAGAFKDGGKTGYHGYWASNFYKEDEHWVSADMDFKALDAALDAKGLKTVLDIVANHGSPSFSMPVDQPKFGEIYDAEGKLVADHQNLPPSQLDEANPLHQFFRHEPDILQLSNLDDRSPKVRDYLINSYLHWLAQGADAIRIDTIKHVPHAFWKEMSDRVRAEYPNLFMFGESYDYKPEFIAQHTLPENGAISVLDFPGQKAISEVFSQQDSDFARLQDYLFLSDAPYANVYELTTFYDNHDMPRMNASDEGFIDAHNWLFTSRGIPVVYMGSEMGFMRGTAEHTGNRNYLGQSGLAMARQSPIFEPLKRIANVRKQVAALQRGVQVNLDFSGNTAAFYRVLQYQGQHQIALVLLNKGDKAAEFTITDMLQPGVWTNQMTDKVQSVSRALTDTVPAHGVSVWVVNTPVTQPALLQQIARQMQ
ncbi:alpha-amylase family glycosyl hydrolase [Bowmanella sp. JS7-9]|uniref:alpha-amylase n=1 Tax=Pseudobowmanella zhangzhouensis TaxID=1537679 RepID=A0ABW1XLC3_9ALTE|nr:alpha-amylase family glycosyl hydrolase [Bowmanella sp. JS7-9]TBX25921.1 cyclomaltodextrin glucanotransferase [Bowmanella sp. JS7-9]